MKKILTVLTIALLVLTGCSKKDGDKKPEQPAEKVTITNEDLYKDIQVVVDGEEISVKNNSANKALETVKYTVKKDGNDYIVTAELPAGDSIVVDGGIKPKTDLPVVDKEGKPVVTEKPTEKPADKPTEKPAEDIKFAKHIEKGVLGLTAGSDAMMTLKFNLELDTSTTFDNVKVTKEAYKETTKGTYVVYALGEASDNKGKVPFIGVFEMEANGKLLDNLFMIHGTDHPKMKSLDDVMKENEYVSKKFSITFK